MKTRICAGAGRTLQRHFKTSIFMNFYRKLLAILVIVCSAIGVSLSQTGRIYGIIADESNNETLIGASVLVVETGGGTVSDIDGSFELKLDPGKYTLEISSIGYQTQK
ncbi:MAG: carboxypeptidase-like regulatory domain-containing protein [Saprospiraceae bacterium]|nr:carboxypeptidase-like regulatory domain-containing protein [Saprospiraceae bacterium]